MAYDKTNITFEDWDLGLFKGDAKQEYASGNMTKEEFQKIDEIQQRMYRELIHYERDVLDELYWKKYLGNERDNEGFPIGPRFIRDFEQVDADLESLRKILYFDWKKYQDVAPDRILVKLWEIPFDNQSIRWISSQVAKIESFQQTFELTKTYSFAKAVYERRQHPINEFMPESLLNYFIWAKRTTEQFRRRWTYNDIYQVKDYTFEDWEKNRVLNYFPEQYRDYRIDLPELLWSTNNIRPEEYDKIKAANQELLPMKIEQEVHDLSQAFLKYASTQTTPLKKLLKQEITTIRNLKKFEGLSQLEQVGLIQEGMILSGRTISMDQAQSISSELNAEHQPKVYTKSYLVSPTLKFDWGWTIMHGTIPAYETWLKQQLGVSRQTAAKQPIIAKIEWNPALTDKSKWNLQLRTFYDLLVKHRLIFCRNFEDFYTHFEGKDVVPGKIIWEEKLVALAYLFFQLRAHGLITLKPLDIKKLICAHFKDSNKTTITRTTIDTTYRRVEKTTRPAIAAEIDAMIEQIMEVAT